MHTLFHACDPETSEQAITQHAAKGARTRNATLVKRLVERLPGRTACELWEECLIVEKLQLKEMQELRRRLTDLKQCGEVAQGEARKCRVKGNKMVTWGIVP